MSQTEPTQTAILPPTLRLGAVHITVTDLGRSVSFYERCIGLRTHRRAGGAAFMGAGKEDLLVLVEAPEARRARDHAGLLHFALMSPTRIEFSRAVLRAAVTRALVERSTDDGYSEAIFISDPDGIGLKVYHDHPQADWPVPDPEGRATGPEPTPLDLPPLMKITRDPGLRRQAEPGLAVGHVALRVGDMEQALWFYRDVLGFELVTEAAEYATLAAGDYHHHVALDTARGKLPPPPAGSLGLRHWTVVVNHEEQVAAVKARVEAAGLAYEERGGGLIVRDPWQLAVHIRAD